MAKDKFKDVVDKLWPKTKKELDKALMSTKKLIDKGESYLKVVSEKSIVHTKKLSLSLRKEKLYYDLGKTVARSPQDKWMRSKKVTAIVKEIKKLERKIKSKH